MLLRSRAPAAAIPRQACALRSALPPPRAPARPPRASRPRAASLPPPPPPPPASLDSASLLSRFRVVASPFWTEGGAESRDAALRLAAVCALSLGATAVSVGFNFLGRDFFNALSERREADFYRLLAQYGAAVAAALPVFVLREYWQSLLALRWRAWLTERYLGRYLEGGAYYALAASGEVDNPDQRVAADVAAFTGGALGLGLTLLSSAVDLASFSGILYSIYPPLFLALIGYAAAGSGASWALGRRLVPLGFAAEAREADFRFGLVRLRENAESVAFYDPGAVAEGAALRRLFTALLDNARQTLAAQRNLSAFTSAYRLLISFLPAAVVAPLYFSGKVEFGVVTQASSAFGHVLSDLSLLVFQFESLAGLAAVTQRVGGFEEALAAAAAAAAAAGGVTRATPDDPAVLLRLESLTLARPRARPDAAPLLRGLSLALRPGQHLLVVGPSGCGKTSLLRAVAGLWREGGGRVEVAAGEGALLFLPQKPYMVLGTLREQLLYPSQNGTRVSDDDCLAALSAVRLRHLTQRGGGGGGVDGGGGGLDAPGVDWAASLSLGEQQRLSFARALLARPRLALLDEASSALDGASERECYAALLGAGATLLSVGHRESLEEFHALRLRLGVGEAGDGFELERICEDPRALALSNS